jgi:hypothetical protein
VLEDLASSIFGSQPGRDNNCHALLQLPFENRGVWSGSWLKLSCEMIDQCRCRREMCAARKVCFFTARQDVECGLLVYLNA